MRSKLSEYDEEFAYKWSVLANRSREKHNHRFKLVSLIPPDVLSVGLICSKQYKQKLIDNLVRTMLTNLTVMEFMKLGNSADDFLDRSFFRCASDKNYSNKKCM